MVEEATTTYTDLQAFEQLKAEMARHRAVQMDVVCTVWEQGLIPSAQCKVDEAQVLSLNRATWPDHLVSDQTVVIQAKTEAKLQ